MTAAANGRAHLSLWRSLPVARRPALMESIIESMPDGVMIVSPAGEILAANETAAALIAAKDGRLVGRSIDEVFGGRFRSSFVAEAAARRVTVTRAHTLPDDRRLVITARRLPLPDGVFVLLIVRDLTALSTSLELPTSQGADGSRQRWTDVRRRDTPEQWPIVAESPAMRAVRARTVECGKFDSPVLLLGPTGTGKSLLARLIHQSSARHRGAFQHINCGAISESLIEAELFGYAKGAFTGADSRGKAGLVELADGGTLLLDEVADLAPGAQVKLLHFLETGEIWPVGAPRAKRIDARIIAATNRDLRQMITRGLFREDLFYRLDVLVIHVPPLREHREDIPPLVKMMLDEIRRHTGRRKSISNAALRALCDHDFPGNVRELWNIVERLVVTTKSDTIELADVAAEVSVQPGPPAIGSARNLREAMKNIEAMVLAEALRRYGSQSEAARHLGVGQATIARKTKEYRLRPGWSSTDRCLLVVSRNRPSLHATLSRIARGNPSIDVVVDRRHGERRRRSEPVEIERRRADRRTRTDVEQQVRRFAYAIVDARSARS